MTTPTLSWTPGLPPPDDSRTWLLGHSEWDVPTLVSYTSQYGFYFLEDSILSENFDDIDDITAYYHFDITDLIGAIPDGNNQ